MNPLPLDTSSGPQAILTEPLSPYDKRLTTALRNGLAETTDLNAPLVVESYADMIRAERTAEMSLAAQAAPVSN